MRFISALAFTLTGFFVGAAFFIAASLVLAWSGPTSAPPNGNVSPPLNVGAIDQIKNAGLGLNSLAVFGNAILSGTSRYLNFGATAGSAGYGIRDNAGTMEFKSSGATSWSSIASIVTNTVTTAIQNFFSSGSSNTVSQIKFSDGTTQTTAGGGATQETTVSCSFSGGSIWAPASCTATCPSGYVRSGCLGSVSGTAPGTCTCSGQPSGSCQAFCVK